MFFDELSNDEWALVSALVAEGEIREHRRGRPRAHPRTIVNAVLWILTTGETWSKLPGHYPTVPTCRRRFNDWQMNGTLIEMVTRLAARGRSFAILPTAPAEVPVRPVQPVYECDRLRGVFWQNPESWGGPSAVGASGADLPFSAGPRRIAEARDVARANAPGPLSATRTAMSPHAAHAHAHGHGNSHSYGRSRLHGQVRETTPMAFEPACVPVHDGHGYTIYAISRPVAGGMFRGWAEIVKDGKRVERSGLIGPRYGQDDEAATYALEWSRRWIAGQSTRVTHPGQERTVPGVAAVDAVDAAPAEADAVDAVDAAPPAVEWVEPQYAN
jgi:transposase